jgi:hypothetical protein
MMWPSPTTAWALLLWRADHPPRPVAGAPRRLPGRVLRDDIALELPIPPQSASALDEPLAAAAGNLAVRSGDLGIEAVAGVTDGGRNKAGGNRNPAHCTNIACR